MGFWRTTPQPPSRRSSIRILAATPDGLTADRVVQVKAAIGWWRSKAWPAHLQRVASNPAYAAAATAILAGMLGLLPARKVIAAVLAAVISARLREGARGEGPGSRRVDPRDFA